MTTTTPKRSLCRQTSGAVFRVRQVSAKVLRGPLWGLDVRAVSDFVPRLGNFPVSWLALEVGVLLVEPQAEIFFEGS